LIRFWSVESDPDDMGRLEGARPVAVLDIGSNSVRLMVYERHARALTILYNEKSSSTLGRGVAATGNLSQASMDKALKAIQRFAMVARVMDVGQVHALATSATREAENGPDFTKAVEAIIGVPVRVLSGPEEAHYAALGAVAGMPGFAGVVGDLGGGSLELAMIADHADQAFETHALGVIRLQDDSNGNGGTALELARERIAQSALLTGGEHEWFCAIGGTWRALAKLHQARAKYPLHMIQDYVADPADLIALCDELVAAAESKKPVPNIEVVSGSRRELLPFGAAVMAEVLRQGRFKKVVFSAMGVREGVLYEALPEAEKAVDPLLQATEEMSRLRSRAPAFAEDLIESSEALFATMGVKESEQEARLRKAACYLSDIGWRAHPDYRGEQSVDAVAFSNFVGVDHCGRAFLALSLAFRYLGLKGKGISPFLARIAGPVLTKRAKLMGAFFRVAYPLAAAMPGILTRVGFEVSGKTLRVVLPADLNFLDGERLATRVHQFAQEAGLKEGKIILS